MKHKKHVEPNRDLYRLLLIDIINPNHELVQLEPKFYWALVQRLFLAGKPAKSDDFGNLAAA